MRTDSGAAAQITGKLLCLFSSYLTRNFGIVPDTVRGKKGWQEMCQTVLGFVGFFPSYRNASFTEKKNHLKGMSVVEVLFRKHTSLNDV